MPGKLVTYVEVLVDVPSASHPYTYLVPAHLEPFVEPGVAVRVPFGSRPSVGGFVVEVGVPAPEARARPVVSVSPGKLLPPAMERLLDWISEHYLASRYQVYQAAVPAGLLAGDEPVRMQLHVDRLADRTPEGLTARQREVLAVLARQGQSMRAVDLEREARTTRTVLAALATAGAIRLERRAVRRTPVRHATEQPLCDLTPEQAAAVRAIQAGSAGAVFLLHGVTGSGKTEVYLRAISSALSQGKGAIVLVPEISLTPQAIARFAGRFGDRVAVLHSGLSDGERFDEWSRVRSGHADVVVGARSAIFAPVPTLGLIIVDEEHDGAYKQESTPRYHARAVALKRAALEGAKVVLGSATPSLESYHAARQGRFHLLELEHRVAGLPMPEVIRVDMRKEASDGNHGLFSRALRSALDQVLEAGEQAILLLNRRGYAPVVLCRSCGQAIVCPTCQVCLTYHRAREALVCHYCDYSRSAGPSCDACGGPVTRYVGAGTQKVVEALASLLPTARVLRLDRDATARKDSHHQILDAFARGDADVLVGTQMVAKGLDFPRVSLVGVLNADAALRLPDFRAAERTFQLVTQVAGRAGRAGPGRVIVQTFAPDHPAIALAAAHDYRTFAAQELDGRRPLGYPPYRRVVRIVVAAEHEDRALAVAARLQAALKDAGTLLGPVAAPLAFVSGQHRVHLLALTMDIRTTIAKTREAVLGNGDRNVKVIVDVDPLTVL